MTESRRQMLFVPEIEPDSFFFFYYMGTTGRSYSVRTYTGPSKPASRRGQDDFPYTAEEILSMATYQEPVAGHDVNDSAYWWTQTRRLNALHLGEPRTPPLDLGGEPSKPMSPSPKVNPVFQADSPFFSHAGDRLRTLDDWRALHPDHHWREGYSAMELARCWSNAAGIPTSFRAAVDSGPLKDFLIERGVVEHQAVVPGKGRASSTDLMLFARTATGSPLVVGVEGKVDEAFGPRVGEWLGQADSDEHRRNREERLEGLCAALELHPAQVLGIRYQLLHRAYATLSTAKSQRAGHALLAVHSLQGRGSIGTNWEDFREFAKLLGCASIVGGEVVRVGPRHGVEMWLVWVTER